MSRPGRFAIVVAFAALVAIWGSTWAAIRIGLGGIPPFTGVALRFAIASALLFVVSRLWRIPLQAGPRVRLLWVVETVFGFSLSYGTVYWAEQWVPSGLGSVLFATFPLFVWLLAWLWLGDERLTARAAVGLLTGFGGVAVLFSEDLVALGGPQVLVASLVFLVSPLSAAVAHVLVKKWGGGIHPINLAGPPMAATALLMGVVALATERHRPVTFDAVSVAALAYLAVMGSAVTFTVYYWLLARVSANRVALITYGIPVVALFLGTVFLDEPLTARTVVGATLVVSGVALAS